VKPRILVALAVILLGLFLLNKVRIIVFGSMWTVFLIGGMIVVGFLLMSGPIKRFIDRYDHDN